MILSRRINFPETPLNCIAAFKARPQPSPQIIGKPIKVVQPLQAFVNQIPVYGQILVGQDIAQAGYGSQFTGKCWRKHTQFPQPQDALIEVPWFWCPLQRNEAVGDVNAALNGDFQVAFHNIAQVHVLEKFIQRFFPDRF